MLAETDSASLVSRHRVEPDRYQLTSSPLSLVDDLRSNVLRRVRFPVRIRGTRGERVSLYGV